MANINDTTEQLNIWEQTDMEGLARATSQKARAVRKHVSFQTPFWEDQLPELLRAIDALPVDLAELGERGERLLKALEDLGDGEAYMAQLDALSALDDAVNELKDVEDLTRHKSASNWRIEMMEELYGTTYK